MQNTSLRHERQTLLVVGMHRSGTSALAQVLCTMGAYAGGDHELLQADRRNPHGYWERHDLLRTHEFFLHENGYDWGSVAGFDIAKVQGSSTQDLRTHLAEIVGRIDSHGAPLLIKDPRLCLLLPVWQQILRNPFYMIVVRDPRRIVASLAIAFPGLFTSHFLLALWQKYLQSALQALKGKSVLFVSYGEFLRNPSSQNARLSQGLIDLGMHNLHMVESGELESVLDSKLNRCGDHINASLSPDQLDLHDWLLAQCRSPGPVTLTDTPAMEAPDDILRELQTVREHCMKLGQTMGHRAVAASSRH